MTSIQWTDATWNPVRGCSRVSAGCQHCYAMGQAHRFAGAGKPYERLTTIRRGKVDWEGSVRLVPEMLAAPGKWKKPMRVFVNSMSDLFHESLRNEEIAAVFGVMAAWPQHTFQVLTKRPKRMKEWFEWLDSDARRDSNGEPVSWYPFAIELSRYGIGVNEELRQAVASHPGNYKDRGKRWPLPNVWLGVSCEDQDAADKRIPLLLETPAAVRFVSAEPLLGSVRLERYMLRHAVGQSGDCAHWCKACGPLAPKPSIDWVIVGGESGPGARDCEVAWIRRIVSDCQRAGVPVFVKQLGAMARDQDHFGAATKGLRDKKGGDPEEWPEDLRVREFPP